MRYRTLLCGGVMAALTSGTVREPAANPQAAPSASEPKPVPTFKVGEKLVYQAKVNVFRAGSATMAVIDSIWAPIAKYLSALPEKYSLDEAYDRVRAGENRSLDQMQIFGPAAKQLLSDEQIRKLPPFIALFLDAKAIRNIRPGVRDRGPGGFGGRPGG